jgi:N-carbamoylputrescine amidase
MKAYMYILRCANNTYYTGSTNDLEKRLEEHHLGIGANYTRKHRPVKLVYFEEFVSIEDAFQREKQVQNWNQKKKEALINRNIEQLKAYSASSSSAVTSTTSAGSTTTAKDSSTLGLANAATSSEVHINKDVQLGNSVASAPRQARGQSSADVVAWSSDIVVSASSTTARPGFTDKKNFHKTAYIRTMKTAIIQQSNTANVATNMKKLAANIAAVAAQGAELVVLQELHNSLYFCQVEATSNFDLAEPIPGPSTAFYGELAKKHQVVLVTSLFEKRTTGLYHNTAVVFEKDGSMAGKYRKMHIPDDPGFYEKFYFTPGDLGYEPIQTSLGKLGVLVCWDQWYPEAARMMALAGAELLIYPTAIGWDMRDDEQERERQKEAWITVQRGHAVANGVPVIAVNRVGFEDDPSGQSAGINFWGSSFVAGPQGELLYEAPENLETNQVIDIDMQRSEDVRRIWPFLRDRRIETYHDLSKRFRD